jgi:hypothetical protein
VLAKSILAEINGCLHMMTPLTFVLFQCAIFPTIHIESVELLQEQKKNLQPNLFTTFQEIIILQEKLRVWYSPFTGHNLERKRRTYQIDFIFSTFIFA